MGTELFASDILTAGQLNVLVKNIMRQTDESDPKKAVRLINSGKWVVSKLLKTSIDNIIHVDRSIYPSYPNWVERVMHPKLRETGPSEYDISAVEQWLHDDQKDKGKYINGNEIYTCLKDTNTLKVCLGLRDLEEIQNKGDVFFRRYFQREYFQSKTVFGWKSLVQHHIDHHHHLAAPFLYEKREEVLLGWRWLDDAWDDGHVTLRFAS